MTGDDRGSEVLENVRGRAWSRARATGVGTYRVDLGGPLRPGWMASLGLELASRNLSVDRASGRRGPKGVWSAQLDLVRLPNGSDPLTLSYVELAETGRTADTSVPLRLDRFTLTESEFHGGCIELDFEAQDSLGLLGRVLAELALHVLFPVVLRIETRAGRVHDRLWLTGINAAPTPEAFERLQQRFARLTADVESPAR